MIPEAAVAILACARIGAIHSVVFGGFSPDSLVNRIQDCESNCVITADEGLRGGRKVPLKANADAALAKCPSVKTCVVVRRTGGQINWVPGHVQRAQDCRKSCASAACADRRALARSPALACVEASPDSTRRRMRPHRSASQVALSPIAARHGW